MRRKSVNGIFDTIHKPSFSNLVKDFPNDTDDWNCSHWHVYFNRIARKHGEVKAREIVAVDLDNVGTFANVKNCRYECWWYNWAQSKGLPHFETPLANLKCGIEDITEIPESIGKPAKILIPLGLLAAGSFYLYNLVK